MTKKRVENVHEGQDLDMTIQRKNMNNKLHFVTWIERYEVNISKLADEIGCSRQHLMQIKANKASAGLETALSIYYISGGLVSLFSLLKYDRGELLRKELAVFINSTHKLIRSKISRGNKLVRYHIRKL